MKSDQPDKKVEGPHQNQPPASSAQPAPDRYQILKAKKILVPLDFSQSSARGLEYALPFAKQIGAELILLHVIQPYPPTPGMPPVEEEVLQRGNATLRAVQTSLGDEVLSKVVLRVGVPYIEIVKAAKELGADLITIATRGRTGLAHILLGSTAERVIRHASCPVVVVRQPEGDSHDTLSPGVGALRTLKEQTRQKSKVKLGVA